jgi:hypothetical protein
MKRGRTSRASLETQIAIVQTPSRPDPPADLCPEERAIWGRVVADKPESFPPSTVGLLKVYCRHAANADRIARLLNQAWARSAELALIDKLSAMHERETRALASLASRMRISQQATISPNRRSVSAGPLSAWIE